MLEMFLDTDKPLHTCKAENCDGCEVSDKLVCHFGIRQLIIFLLMAVTQSHSFTPDNQDRSE